MSEPVEAMATLPEVPTAMRAHADPKTPTERLLCEVLGGVVHADRVSVDSHFFEDLGADSLVMAHFCARVRKQPDLPPVSMKEIYRHPTIRRLAAAITVAAPDTVAAPAPVAPPVEAAPRARTGQVVLCGALQLLIALGYLYLGAIGLARGTTWAAGGSGFVEIYVRSAVVVTAGFLGSCLVPILAKWVLIGRWTSRRIRIWSLGYVRFWVVKTLVRANPMVLFAGTPIYVLYLRALGAKIGRGTVILSHHVPVCTDLLAIGDHAIVRKDSHFSCYRARAGYIETGPVRIGRDAFVGEMAVLDIGTALGDEAQLGHSSSLHSGQSIPDGEHRQGSPARQRTGVDYRSVPSADCSTLRRVAFSIVDLVLVLLPLPLLSAITLATDLPQLSAPAAFSNWALYRDILAGSFVLFFGGALATLVIVVTVPRLLNLVIEPDRAYALYGFRYWAHRTIGTVSNSRFFIQLLGDSSYIVPYLRWLGYDLSRVVQTGSNFGTNVKHDNPFLVSVGSGTMVADGLSMINADYSSTSFRVSRVAIGPDNFIGNDVAYPSQGRTGGNCLLATKVLVPVEGDVREGTGLLGSPSFEIPRSVLRDSGFDHLSSGGDLSRRLAAKNRHNLRTIGWFLFVHWIHLFAMLLLADVVMRLQGPLGAWVIALGVVGTLLFSAVYLGLAERASTWFRALQPQHCSIYDSRFWSHERYWKLMVPAIHLTVFDGTPFKPMLWRLLGVRIGKRVFDDGCAIVERTMVSLGDDCTLNAGSVIQPHSQEDGGFKSDRIAIGAGCTIGIASLVHYGVTMGDGVELGPHAFLMKGEEAPSYTRWGENPARELRDDPAADTALAAPPALLVANGIAVSRKGGQAA